jgi:hypothetical protein
MDITVLQNAGISSAFVALAYIVYQLCAVVITHPWRCRSHCCCSEEDTVIEFDEPTPPELRRPVLNEFFYNYSPGI